MTKIFLGISFCLCLAMVGEALALDGTTTNVNSQTYINPMSRNQPGKFHRYVHQPFSKKNKGTGSPVKLNPLNKPVSASKTTMPGKTQLLDKKGKPVTLWSGFPHQTPVAGKTQVLDSKGNPVTLWPGGQPKNYPTLYQDLKVQGGNR